MEVRILRAADDGEVTTESLIGRDESELRWEWIDILVGEFDHEAGASLSASLGLDPLAVHDALHDFDLPKVDDLGSQIHVVLHGLRRDEISASVVGCFLTDRRVVTLRRHSSPSLDALHEEMLARSSAVVGSADDVLALVADAFARQHLAVLTVFEDRTEDLVASALAADPAVVTRIMAISTHIAVLAHAAKPQREALHQLRSMSSPLISNVGRRRLSDAFDVSERVLHGVDRARVALGEILDAYRGAEAARATNVNRLLTVYATLALPLFVVTGFYGMNFPNLPFASEGWGWIALTVFMAVMTAASIWIFVSQGWMGRWSFRRPATPHNGGLAEATRAPVRISSASWEAGSAVAESEAAPPSS